MAQDPQQEQYDDQNDQGGDEQFDNEQFDEQQGGQNDDQGGQNEQEQKMQKSDQFETNWDKVVESFDHMNLKEDLLRGIYAYGFEKPSAIQQRGILPVIQSLVKQIICDIASINIKYVLYNK